jgi:hypothetical protein
MPIAGAQIGPGRQTRSAAFFLADWFNEEKGMRQFMIDASPS